MNLLVLCFVVAFASLAATETYTDRYDDMNIDEILANRRLMMPYMKCILGQGPCTPEGKELRLHIKDAMQTACEKCTEKQQRSARQIVKHIRANELQFWEQVKAKYDPGDKFKETYEAFLARDD